MIDCNLIAYEYYKNPYVKNDVYTSGEKEETSLTNRYSYSEGLAVLVLEEDIINSEDYGLKKGFYNVLPDKYNDFLLILQSGKIMAKVPVVKMEVTASSTGEKQKVKKMSPRAYNNYLKKQYKKYYKGINPENIEYREAQLLKDKENNCYIIEYRTNIVILSGIIKL